VKYKKLLSAILVIIAALAGAPYFVGDLARENIERQAAEISKIPGYSLKIRQYDQGWFTSHAVIAYGFDEHTLNIMRGSDDADGLDKAAIAALTEGLVFDATIAHGPVTLQNGLNFALLTLSSKLRDIDHEAYRQFKQRADIDSLAELDAVVSYGGATRLHGHSPAFMADYSDLAGKKMIINFAGIDIRTSVSAATDQYDMALQLEHLALDMAEGKLNIDQAGARAEGQKINQYLWTGKGASTIGRLDFTAPPGLSLSLENFTSDYDFGRENGRKNESDLTLHWRSAVGELLTSDVSLKNFTLDLDLTHLDREALTDYVRSIRQSYENTGETPPTAAETASKMQAIATRVGERLLKNSPELIINKLAFQMGGGFFDSDAHLTINGDGLDNIRQLSDPVALNKRLTNLANIRFDKNMAVALTAIGMEKQMTAAGMDVSQLPKEQFRQMIDVQASTLLQNFVNQGYFEQNGVQFSTRFEMKDGQRLVNGKPLPIPGM